MESRTPKEEFIELITDINKMKGLDELTSRIIGILYIEPHEVAMEDLAQRTGYSLSAVSTATSSLERAGMVKRLKKPKSRRLYYFIEKDAIQTFIQLIQTRQTALVEMAKERMPRIIEHYRKKRNKDSEAEIHIIEAYYKQINILDRVLKKIIQLLKEEHAKEMR